jgi:hypothetical protein
MDRTIWKNRENVNQHTGDSSSIFTMRNRWMDTHGFTGRKAEGWFTLARLTPR